MFTLSRSCAYPPLLALLLFLGAGGLSARAARPNHVAEVDLIPGQESARYRSAVIDPVANLLYTASLGYSTIQVNDLNTNLGVAQITLPNGGVIGMAVDPAGHRLFVVAGGSSLFVVNTLSLAVTTVTLPSTVNPSDLAFDAGLNRIYISSSDNTGGVTEIDGSSYNVLRKLATGPGARSVTFNPSTHVVYATSAVSASDSSSTEVCFFDPNNAIPTDTVPLNDFGELLRYVAGVDRLYIAGTSSQSLFPVDATSHSVLGKVPLSVPPGVFAAGGGMVYCASFLGSGVDVFNPATGQVYNLPLGTGILSVAANPSTGELIALQGMQGERYLSGLNNGSVALGASPSAVALHPGRHRRYIASSNSQSLLVFGDDGTAVANIALGGVPSDVVVNAATDRVYVILPGLGILVAIDAATNEVLFERPVTVETSPGNLENFAPTKLALDAAHNRLYVMQASFSTYVSVVDGSVDGATIDPVNHQAFGPFGGGGRAIAVDAFKQIVYLAASAHLDAGQPTERDSKAILALSGTGGAVLATLMDPQTADSGSFGSLAVNATTGKIYATTTDAQGRPVVDVFGAAGSNSPSTLLASLSLPPFTYGGLLAVNPELNRIYVYTGFNSTNAYLHTIDGATDTLDAAFDPTRVNGATGLVYDAESHQVVSVSGSDALGGLLHVYFDGPDTVPPTGTILSPDPSSQNAAILLTSGSVRVSDDRSAIASVEISLQNPDSQYWNGSAWVTNGSEVFFPAITDGSGTYTFAMPTRAQGLVRGAYTLHARLTDAAGNTTTKSSQFSIITPGGFSFSQPNYAVSEDAGTVTVTVVREGGSDGTATVRYSLSDGTARLVEADALIPAHGFVTEGDYRLTLDPDYAQPGKLPQPTFLLSFGPGVTTQTFSFPITPDSLIEGPQTIRLGLEQASPGAELGPQSGALATIADNPPASAVASFVKSIALLDGVQTDHIQHMVYDAASGKLYAQGKAGGSTGLYEETSVCVINTQTGLRETAFPLEGEAYGSIGIDPALNRLYALRLPRGDGAYFNSSLFLSVYDLTTHRRLIDTKLPQLNGTNGPQGSLVVDHRTHRVYATGLSGTVVYDGVTDQVVGQFGATGDNGITLYVDEPTGQLYVDDHGSIVVVNTADGSQTSAGNLPAGSGMAINQTTGAAYGVAGSNGEPSKLVRLSGVTITASVDLLGAGQSAVVDEAHNRVLVVESFSNNLQKVYTFDGDTLAQIGSPVTVPAPIDIKPPLVYLPDLQRLFIGTSHDSYDSDRPTLHQLDLGSGAYTNVLTAAHPSETATIHTADYDKTYAASQFDGFLFVVDGRTDTLLKTIQLPGAASQLSPVDSLGRIYFVCTVSTYSPEIESYVGVNQLMVLDCATDSLLNLKTIDFSILSTTPQDHYFPNTLLRTDAAAKKLYVESTPSGGSNSTVSVLDVDPTHTQAFHTVLAQRTFTPSDTVGFSSMIVSPIRHRLYLVEAVSGGANIQRLLTLDGGDLHTVSTGDIVSGSIFLNHPSGIAIDTAAERVYVQSDQEETFIMDVNPASSSYNQSVGDLNVRQYYGGIGYGSLAVAVNPGTHHAFVSDDGRSQTVALVLDGVNKAFTDTLCEIGQCEFLSINTATQKVYAASASLGKITVLGDRSGPGSILPAPSVPRVTVTLPAILKSQFTLQSTEASTAPGLKVRFQYQLAGQSDWTDLVPLPGRTGTSWGAAYTSVPAGDVVFRAVASATDLGDQPSNQTASVHVSVDAIAPLATPTLVSATLSPTSGKWTFSITAKVPKTTGLVLQYSRDGVTFLDVPNITIIPGATGRFLITTSAVLPGDAGFFRVIAKNGTAPDSLPSKVYSRYGVDASIAQLTLPEKVGKYLGSRVINPLGTGQTKAFRAPEGVRETFLIHAANASALPDTLLAQADGGDSHFVVRYYRNAGTALAPVIGAEITSAMVNGSYAVSVTPGGSGDIVAEVITVGETPRNTARTIRITWHSQHDPTRLDAVALAVTSTDSLNTVFVTTGDDSGDGSLRAALLWAQAHRGTTIEFEVPPEDSHFVMDSGLPVLHLHPATPLPALTAIGTILDGVSQAEFEGFISSASPRPAVYLEGNEVSNSQQGGAGAVTGSNGLLVQAAGCQIRGLTFAQFSQGVTITGSAVNGGIVQGCYFLGNYSAGVKVDGSANHTLIGGPKAGQRNVFRAQTIAGQTYGFLGVFIAGEAHDNLVQGNFIGTSDDGEKDADSQGLQSAGILVDTGLRNILGGTLPGLGNVIGGTVGSSGQGAGISIGSAAVTIQGNLIGCTAGLRGPVTANPNGYGINIVGLGNGTHIGAAKGIPNVISGNQFDGIKLGIALTQIEIVNNSIGLAPDGHTALPNGGNGIRSAATTLGVLSNFLGANEGFGIFLGGVPHALHPTILIEANVIGVGRDGGFLPNGLGGIELFQMTGVKIGDGTATGANIITHNHGAGIGVDDSSTGNAFRRNQNFDNDYPGIDLRPAGGENDPATPNDAGDANGLQNYPVINSVTRNGKSFTVKFDLDARANTKYAIDLYVNLPSSDASRKAGKIFLQTVNVTTPKMNGHVTPGFTILDLGKLPGMLLTATATNLANQSTSEYSNGVAIP